MGRKSRRKAGARRYADYSQETLNLAVDLVNSKSLSSYEAEKQFGILRRTILNKCRNRHNKPIGRPLELTAEEEKHIAEVVEICAEHGCPLSILDLRIVVYNYLQKCGRTEIFGGRMPGERWARNFLDRHNFSQRVTQNIKRNRAAKTVEEMTTFYKNLEVTLKDVPCQNILNFDETNLSDDPGSSKVIFKRGTKHPERVINSSKSSVSIMFSATADGQCLPPYVVYKAEHLWSRWCELGPPNARYNRTKSGWFDMLCFDDRFKTIILPWANSREGTKVIIGDNLASHLSIEVVKLCEENNIRLVFLPRNATHLTQPLDVAFFGPMKKCWRKIMLHYKLTHPNSTTLNKCEFPQLLQELMSKIDMSNNSNIRSGFSGSGIFPFDPSRVTKKIPVVSTEDTKKFDTCLLQYLQKVRNSTTTQSKTGPNKKFVVEAGKSVSTEDAEKMKKSKDKGKGKGKTTKKSPANPDLDIVNLPVINQPKSLKYLCMQLVNKCVLNEIRTEDSNRTNMPRKKSMTKKKTMNSNVRTLSEMSKTDKENSPFVATGVGDMPIILQKSNLQKSKPAKKSQIKILSNVLIKPSSSNSLDNPSTREDLKMQHNKSKCINIKRKWESSEQKNESKAKKLKRRKYNRSKNVSQYSDSTTSVSNDMSEHSDSILIDIDLESDTESELYSKLITRNSSKAASWQQQQLASSLDDPSQSADDPDLLPFRPSLCENSIFSITDREDVLLDNIPRGSDQTAFDYSVDDTVLVRYYTKRKDWKYYIGVITACNIDQTYDISFYTTTRNKGELKFKKTKKIDKDTVPKISIEKIIEIDKISVKPEEYKLRNLEDENYF